MYALGQEEFIPTMCYLKLPCNFLFCGTEVPWPKSALGQEEFNTTFLFILKVISYYDFNFYSMILISPGKIRSFDPIKSLRHIYGALVNFSFNPAFIGLLTI
jgi:hypothetical protein